LSIPQNVDLLTDIDFLKLIELYRNASLVVIPLYENNYSAGFTVLFQAMAMGKAVILSDVSAIKKSFHFKDMENCILVPPGDIHKLELAIKYLYENVKTREKIGNNARELININYSLDQFIMQLDNLFKNILNTKRN
jgi:glycosyltransferase involved in cell wall biosynthesis